MKSFILDGIKGYVQNGFVTWATIGCHLEDLKDGCALKVAAQNAK
jgi:hypothetical protein